MGVEVYAIEAFDEDDIGTAVNGYLRWECTWEASWPEEKRQRLWAFLHANPDTVVPTDCGDRDAAWLLRYESNTREPYTVADAAAMIRGYGWY